MKLKMKKIGSLAAAAAMCLSVLCACSESNRDSSESAADHSSAAISSSVSESSSADESSAADSSEDSSDSSKEDTADSSGKEDSDNNPDGITPAMWTVTSPNGNTMTMFGSIHALTDDCYPLPEEITNAYENADILAVECDVTVQTEDAEYQKNLMKQMLYNDGSKLSDHISEDAFTALDTYMQTWGMSAESFEVYRPWAIDSTLESLVIMETGLDTTKGIDLYFLNLAHEENKEIYEIESVDFQMNMLMNFSDDIYGTIFKSYGEETADSQKQLMNEMISAWKNGDMETFIEDQDEDESGYSEEDLKNIKEYNNILLYDRNINMVKSAEQLMDEGKNVFYVVGAAHYAGEGGIIDLLEKDGYKAERVEYGK